MKKTLIAMAVLAASGASMAQSSVTLYGVADIWLGSVKSEETGSASLRQTKVDSGGVATSRFGFKGSEDLGGGLKANFQLEQGINIDNGSAQDNTKAFSRQAWVGVSGGFGEVQLGKVWTSYDDIRSSANDTFNANIAASFATWAPYNDRTNNGVKYTSPSFGGVSGSVTYSFGEDKTVANGASSLASLGLQYANGPIFVGFAHQAEKAGPGTVLAIADALDITTVVRGTKATYNLLNGSYDFGVAKLVGGYNTVKATEPGSTGNAKAKEYNLGVEVPLAANLKLGAGYANSKLSFDGIDVVKTKGYSAALLYSLSKRTTVYGALQNVKSEDLVGANFEAKSTLYAVGVNHTF